MRYIVLIIILIIFYLIFNKECYLADYMKYKKCSCNTIP